MNPRQPLTSPSNLKALATWVPGLFFLVTAACVLLLWYNSDRTERRHLMTETTITSEQVASRLEAWIDARIAALHFLGRNLRSDPMQDADEFRAETGACLELYPGFQALNFIDPDWVIRVVNPVAGNQAALNKDLHLHPAPGVSESVGRAEVTGSMTRTPLIHLLQDKPGFATYLPLFLEDGRRVGFINGVFTVGGLVESCLSDEALTGRFRLGLETMQGEAAYWSEGLKDEPWPRDFTARVPLRVVDGNWLLKMAPLPATLESDLPLHDEYLAIGGILLVAMLTLLLRAYLMRMAELRGSQEVYRLLVDNVGDLVVRIDPQGRVAFCSPSFIEFLGLAAGMARQRPLEDFTHPDDLGHLAAVLSGDKDDLSDREFDLRIMTPHGYRWTGWTFSGYRASDGHEEGFVGVGRDTHLRRELEEQLQRAQKLQAVGQLAGGIAHDFNNIIQAIEGYVEFVKDDLPEDSEQRADLEQALLAAGRAAKLTRQLLAFSSRQVVTPVELDLHEVIRDMAPMLASMFGEEISLEFELDRQEAWVLADSGQIEQILMNLCVNSRDALEQGGRVVVGTDRIDLTPEDCQSLPWAKPGRWIRLLVRDDGCGMDAKTRSKVFEPFFTTKEPGKGTGLGLATVYGIVKQHGGLVHIESEPGRGTEVSIYLARTTRRERRDPAGATGPAGGKGETILVVEDQDQVRNLCARILGEAGYKVLTAAGGDEALQVLDANRSHVAMILLDLVLPGFDGREVQARILASDPGVRILFMSGYDPDSTRGFRSGPEPLDLLGKPFTSNELLAAVRRVLDRP